MTRNDLIRLRRSWKITQARLGEMVGYNKITICLWENGKYKFTPAIVREIERALLEEINRLRETEDRLERDVEPVRRALRQELARVPV